MTQHDVTAIAHILCDMRMRLTENERGTAKSSAVVFSGALCDFRRLFRAEVEEFDDIEFTDIVFGRADESEETES